MIDLHCHSTVSDGTLEPQEVVRLAAANGCRLLALTDHDHTGGIAAARAEAAQHGIRLISGVEISTSWRGSTVHIVGLDFDEHDANLQSLLARLRGGREERLCQIAAKLEKKGIFGAYEGALALSSSPETVSRTHIAEFLRQQGVVSRTQQAFDKYLGEGKAAYVRHQWAELAETVQAITGAGGIAVIAHPMRYGFSATAKRRLIEEFKTEGGRAIEIHSGRSPMNERMNYALLASSGSDFHRPQGYGGTLGVLPELPPDCDPIWQHLRPPFRQPENHTAQ